MTAFEAALSQALDVPAEQVTDDLGPAVMGSWTSLRHVQIIATMQRLYGVRFLPREVRSMRTVGQLRQILRDKGVQL